MILSRVHLFCFAASYTVALLLEVSRLFFRAPARLAATAGFTLAGLVAETAFIALRTAPESQAAPPLSGWFDWLLLLSWCVAAVYFINLVRRPQTALGIFLLPLVLLLIAVAAQFRHVPPFARNEALRVWGMVHGIALLAGTVLVTLGFAAGLMYLLHSYRLKHKLPPRQGLKLPSLEWLQGVTRQMLRLSSYLLAAGLVAGVILNLVKRQAGLPWTDPVVWTSAILLAWLVLVLWFEWWYKPAQQGRKVAYLTLASFVCLTLVLGMVLVGPSQHALESRVQGGQPGSPAAAVAGEGAAR